MILIVVKYLLPYPKSTRAGQHPIMILTILIIRTVKSLPKVFQFLCTLTVKVFFSCIEVSFPASVGVPGNMESYKHIKIT